jgi:seryl-tRNA synthetase
VPEPDRYSRGEYTRALVANALLAPFNVVLLALLLIAAIALDAVAILGPVAVAFYLAAAGRTFLDEREADKVLERERTRRRAQLGSARAKVDPESFSPPIRRLVAGAVEREERIHDAISRAELPYEEVAEEVDKFVAAMQATARRAQLLYEALADQSPKRVAARLGEAREAGKRDLAAALETQLGALTRMQDQLDRFFDEMERLLVELDTIRSHLVSVSASSETAEQARLAGEVRALREQVGAVADGMAAAYESG